MFHVGTSSVFIIIILTGQQLFRDDWENGNLKQTFGYAPRIIGCIAAANGECSCSEVGVDCDLFDYGRSASARFGNSEQIVNLKYI
jgi:hypothetical protein